MLFLLVSLDINPVFSQSSDSLDDLFADAEDKSLPQPDQVDHLSQFVSTSGIIIKGSFRLDGGMGAGWLNWPSLANPGLGFNGFAGFKSSAGITFDARPDPDFAFYLALATAIDPLQGAYSWSSISVPALYVDYTIPGNILFRIGKFGQTWGQGRLFGTVTNIISDLENGFTVRASFPTIGNGLSLLGMIQPAFVASGSVPSWKSIGLAARFDQLVLSTMTSLHARFQVNEGLTGLFSLKRVIAGIDFLADFYLNYNNGRPTPKALLGGFRQFDNWVFYAEYFYNGTIDLFSDHTAAVAFGYNNIFSTKIDFGMQWAHAFIDHSGSVTAVLSWNPFKFVNANLLFPLVYGADDTRYATMDPGVPGNRRIGMIFNFRLNVNF